VTVVQRVAQSSFVDQPPASAIDNPHAVFRFRKAGGIEHVPCLSGERRMQRNEIRLAKKIIQLIGKLDLHAARAGRGQVGIECNHAHAEGDGAPTQFAADAAHSDHAQNLVVKLDALQILSVPLSAAHGGVRLRNLARHGKKKRKCVLGGGDSVTAGRIEDDDAALGGGFDIHIVNAHASAAHHSQRSSCLQNGGIHFCFAAYDDGAEAGDKFQKLRLGEAGFHDHVENIVAR